MIFGPVDQPIPEIELSEQRMAQMLSDIKRNSRNRRIALFAPVVLAAAVIGAMIAAPPQHGGLALTADAEAPDPQLPRVFGSNGVWRLAEPIEDGPVVDDGPASVIEAPAEPDAPQFTLSPPDENDLNSLPASTSTPPTSTSGQSPDAAADAALPSEADDPADIDWSTFGAEIRIEPAVEEAPASTADEPADEPAVDEAAALAEEPASDEPGADEAAVPVEEPASDEPAADEAAPDEEPAEQTQLVPLEPTGSTPEDTPTDDVTVAAEPQTESSDSAEANPSTPPADLTTADTLPFSTPATIVPQSVLVYSAHVSVSVQVVDDDSSVIDWCNTRVDWGDGSVSRVAGADDAALCTAPCEYEATSSAAGEDDASDANGAVVDGSINETIQFEHSYTQTIDASPRIFVATGDGCSYTLAELQLAPFTVVPLP